MAFWEDLSTPVKGVIVVGAVLLVYLAVAALAGLPPYGGGSGEPTQQTRGLQR